jgi:hypothetical protein
MWWLRDPQGTAGWGVPHVVQLMRVRELRYRKAAPPPADTTGGRAGPLRL